VRTGRKLTQGKQNENKESQVKGLGEYSIDDDPFPFDLGITASKKTTKKTASSSFHSIPWSLAL
jgi:hypothetical protein